MKAQPKASHFVDGAYVEDSKGAVIDVIYPATGEVIARVHEATPAVIEAALASANRAQAAWAATRPVERARILRRAADLIRERNPELARLETLDTGKPLQETLVADWPSGADALEYFAGLAPTVGGETIPLGRDFVYTIREALGVCVGIGAWNYPSQIACWKSAPALALGNAMVFKPSEVTPLGALKLAEIFIEAGLPAGLFNVVQGRGAVGGALPVAACGVLLRQRPLPRDGIELTLAVTLAVVSPMPWSTPIVVVRNATGTAEADKPIS